MKRLLVIPLLIALLGCVGQETPQPTDETWGIILSGLESQTALATLVGLQDLQAPLSIPTGIKERVSDAFFHFAWTKEITVKDVEATLPPELQFVLRPAKSLIEEYPSRRTEILLKVLSGIAIGCDAYGITPKTELICQAQKKLGQCSSLTYAALSAKCGKRSFAVVLFEAVNAGNSPSSHCAGGRKASQGPAVSRYLCATGLFGLVCGRARATVHCASPILAR